MEDVIIIGGSFAGLAAALQLGRAGRKVTVLDTGLPRNRFAEQFDFDPVVTAPRFPGPAPAPAREEEDEES